ncbi:MAG: lipid A biosynthesis acyltransferase [Planctomycetaceae bacterium]|nr:lipid A biosynthesis acyltransferase [Planctomycetaceae bacterium]
MGSRRSPWLPLRHLLEYFVFRTIVCLLQILTPQQNLRLAESLAHFVFHVLPRKVTRYKVARENLQIAFGDEMTDEEADRTIYGMWLHLFRMITEIVQMPRRARIDNYHQLLTFRNRTGVVKSMCSERPTFLLSGHYGNWEVSITVFGLFGFPMGMVARPLDNPYLNAWFDDFRKFTGHWMIAKKGAYKQMADILANGGSVALLGDQDAGTKGTFVPFFGRQASTFPTIARLAIEYDATICLGYSRRLEDDFDEHPWVHYELGCEEVIDPRDFADDPEPVDAITRQFTNALERAVRLAPEQYFWVHRRWKTRPPHSITSSPPLAKAG